MCRQGNKTPYTEYLKSKQLFEAYHAEIAPVLARGGDRHLMYSGRTSAVPQEHTQTAFVADRAIDWLRDYQARQALLSLGFFCAAASADDRRIPLGGALQERQNARWARPRRRRCRITPGAGISATGFA